VTTCKRLDEEVPIAYERGEWDVILSIAAKRQRMNVAEGLAERYGTSEDYGDALRKHELGCLGEFSLCRHLSLNWVAAFDRRARADVGDCYQVRCVDKASREYHSLITHPADAPEQVYVLAVADFDDGIVTLKGWLYGRWAKESEHWREPPEVSYACFMAHESRLKGMASLPKEALA
jgi:hypothetical protein